MYGGISLYIFVLLADFYRTLLTWKFFPNAVWQLHLFFSGKNIAEIELFTVKFTDRKSVV